MFANSLRSAAVRICTIVAALLIAAPADAAVTKQLKDVVLNEKETLRYTLILPDGFDAKQTYPVIIALPGGPQNFQMMSGLAASWDQPLATRKWIVVVPAALEGKNFYNGSEKAMPALFDDIAKSVIIEGNKFHLVGYSNGGVSSFRVAVNHPDRVASIVTLPGYPHPDDFKKLPTIKHIPVRLYVGSDDTLPWLDGNRSCETELKKLGGDVTLNIVATNGHFIRAMPPEKIIQVIEPLRKAEGTVHPEAAETAKALDAFHLAASKADEKTYFDCMAPEFVFIGTDAKERWTLNEFREYAKPLFSKGRGWTYKVRLPTRHFGFAPAAASASSNPDAGPTVAWFDEILDNEKFGVCRGTGVMRKIDGKWKLSQYHLTIPMPNELAEQLTRTIKAKAPKEKK